MINPNASGTKVEWEGPGHYWFNPLVKAWIKIQDSAMVEHIAKFRPVRELTAADVREQVCLAETPSHHELNELFTTLVNLGYDARLVTVNGDLFEFNQNGETHYLSCAEAECLTSANLPHPVYLKRYATWNGLNYWYSFEESKEGGSL